MNVITTITGIIRYFQSAIAHRRVIVGITNDGKQGAVNVANIFPRN